MARRNGKLDPCSCKEKPTFDTSKEVIKFSYRQKIKVRPVQSDGLSSDFQHKGFQQGEFQFDSEILPPAEFWKALGVRINRMNRPVVGYFALQVEVTHDGEG